MAEENTGISLQVLQEYFVGVRLPEKPGGTQSVILSVGSSGGTQMAMATFREEDFKLSVKHRYEVGDMPLCVHIP